jgi:hypothetical protein
MNPDEQLARAGLGLGDVAGQEDTRPLYLDRPHDHSIAPTHRVPEDLFTDWCRGWGKVVHKVWIGAAGRERVRYASTIMLIAHLKAAAARRPVNTSVSA